MNEYVCAWKSIYTQNGHETRTWWNMRFNSSKPWLLEAVPWKEHQQKCFQPTTGSCLHRIPLPPVGIFEIWDPTFRGTCHLSSGCYQSQASCWGMRIPTSWTGSPIHGFSGWPLCNLSMCWLWDIHFFTRRVIPITNPVCNTLRGYIIVPKQKSMSYPSPNFPSFPILSSFVPFSFPIHFLSTVSGFPLILQSLSDLFPSVPFLFHIWIFCMFFFSQSSPCPFH